MDYSATSAPAPQLAAVPDKPFLECLTPLNERASIIADRLQRFLSRFHGTGGPDTGGTPAGGGYRTDLDRLSGTFETIESYLNELDRIG